MIRITKNMLAFLGALCFISAKIRIWLKSRTSAVCASTFHSHHRKATAHSTLVDRRFINLKIVPSLENGSSLESFHPRFPFSGWNILTYNTTCHNITDYIGTKTRDFLWQRTCLTLTTNIRFWSSLLVVVSPEMAIDTRIWPEVIGRQGYGVHSKDNLWTFDPRVVQEALSKTRKDAYH